MIRKIEVPAWFDQWAKAHRARKAFLDQDSQTLYLVRCISSSETAGDHVLTATDKIWLMRAALDGYIVVEPKYLLPLEATETTEPRGQTYAGIRKNGQWFTAHLSVTQAKSSAFYVTRTQLEAAPAWVKAIEPIAADPK
ncbi:hypothetical protein [Loigolactobacillus coryniformis]|uniref:hypothetical protein n=1 Tax=Loigolactobacillus coryniformis TaxID=1610 RepID=UPI00345D6660